MNRDHPISIMERLISIIEHQSPDFTGQDNTLGRVIDYMCWYIKYYPELLIRNFVDINGEDTYKQTLLGFALERYHYKAVYQLVYNGAVMLQECSEPYNHYLRRSR